jgi:hypothetical protein
MDLGNKTQFVFRPDYQDAGVKHLNIKIKDGQFSSQNYRVTLNIQNTNRKPFFDNNETIAVAEKQKPAKKGFLTIVDYDADDKVEEVQIGALPPNFTVERVPGESIIAYELQPDWDQQGTYNIPVGLYDGHDWLTENMVIVVQNVNRMPEIRDSYRVSVLENQLVTYTVTVYDPDGDPLELDFRGFPFPAGVLSSRNVDAYTAEFTVWARPGFVSSNLNTYDLGLFDTYDLKMDFQRFDIGQDTEAPLPDFAETPASATYAWTYPYLFTVRDNVWAAINVKVYRGEELLADTAQTTNTFALETPLTIGQNALRFVFTDGAGNARELTNTIALENIGYIDPGTGIYVEIPVGAYALNKQALLAKKDTVNLVNENWQAGHLPYAIARFSTPSFVAEFDPAKLTAPLSGWTTLNVPARFIVKVPKAVNENQKVNPALWDPVEQKWLAHTAKRLTPEEFGVLPIPAASFNLADDEELICFESPALGLFSLMLYETEERPQIRLINTEDYYDVGQNKVLFTVKGNYLRLENLRLWLNGVTLNPALDMDQYMDNFSLQSGEAGASQNAALEYDPKRSLFTVAAEGFTEGNNILRVQAENLVHTAAAEFSLPVNTTKLAVREVYAYPNPAREAGEQMIRFSCILSKAADITIRIYTNQGHLVKELRQDGQVGFNAVPWDGRDKYDNQTANGMYLYVITIDDGDTKIIQKKKAGILL